MRKPQRRPHGDPQEPAALALPNSVEGLAVLAILERMAAKSSPRKKQPQKPAGKGGKKPPKAVRK